MVPTSNLSQDQPQSNAILSILRLNHYPHLQIVKLRLSSLPGLVPQSQGREGNKNCVIKVRPCGSRHCSTKCPWCMKQHKRIPTISWQWRAQLESGSLLFLPDWVALESASISFSKEAGDQLTPTRVCPLTKALLVSERPVPSPSPSRKHSPFRSDSALLHSLPPLPLPTLELLCPTQNAENI